MYDVVETIENLELSEMVKALDSVGLNEDYFLESGSNFTVFAPTNEAFQKYLGVASVAPGITLQVLNRNLSLCMLHKILKLKPQLRLEMKMKQLVIYKHKYVYF